MLVAFGIRLHLGISSLPLRLGGRLQSEGEATATWDSVQMLILVLVCPLFLLHQFLGILFSIPIWLYPSGGAALGVLAILEDVVTPAALVLVAILVLGGPGKESARSSARLPEPRFAFLGLMLPVLIAFMISALQYGYDRVNWAMNDFGGISPPDFTSYFSWTGSWPWTLVVMVFAAFAEEIIFRGMLLRPLLQRAAYTGAFSLQA